MKAALEVYATVQIMSGVVYVSSEKGVETVCKNDFYALSKVGVGITPFLITTNYTLLVVSFISSNEANVIPYGDIIRLNNNQIFQIGTNGNYQIITAT